MIGRALDIAPSPAFEARLKESKIRQAAMENPSLRDGPEHVIIGARQEGKTTLALKWLTECPEGVERVLLVCREDVAKHMRAECGFKANDHRIISYRTLINKGLGARREVEYGIDETVQVLMELLGLKEMPHLVTIAHAESWQGLQPGS